MSQFIVDLSLDGYETDEEHDRAALVFIEEQLDFSASSVRVKRCDYDSFLTVARDAEKALQGLRDAAHNAMEHPNRRGEWEDVNDALNVADVALASLREHTRA